MEIRYFHGALYAIFQFSNSNILKAKSFDFIPSRCGRVWDTYTKKHTIPIPNNLLVIFVVVVVTVFVGYFHSQRFSHCFRSKLKQFGKRKHVNHKRSAKSVCKMEPNRTKPRIEKWKMRWKKLSWIAKTNGFTRAWDYSE